VIDLCRNRCGYCSFRSDRARLIDRKDAFSLLQKGVDAGCAEALLVTGDRPWDHPAFRNGSKEDVLSHMVEISERALELGLLPHTNAGILYEDEMRKLSPYNASMGLMLETTACVDAHRDCPGKDPQTRIDHMERAGRLKIPITTGLLVGIGESFEDRVRSLQAIASLHKAYGHIQEVIVQGLDPKPGTMMAGWDPPSILELAAVVRLARSILPESIAIQVPPNLFDPLPLVEAGATDLGGISEVTPDWINPGRPWPTMEELRVKLPGYHLRERLAVHPRYVRAGWYGSRTEGLVKRLAGPDGLRAIS